MKVISMSKLSQKDFSVSSLYSRRQIWGEGAIFRMEERRKQSALLWFCGAEAEYISEDGSVLHVPRNSLLSIPENSRYTSRFFNKTETYATVLLEFCLSDNGSFVLTEKITVLDIVEKGTKIADSMLSIANDFAMPVYSLIHVKAEFYKLLHRLIVGAETHSIDLSGVRLIEQGIRYLQKDEMQSLSIDEIAKMCFVSSNYFRRLFKKFAGISPANYRLLHKIERAKSLLENSDLSIVQISYTLNYNSPAYFCRIFKKHTKMTPSIYRAKIKED
jgi:AraC-like DNA-binding protein